MKFNLMTPCANCPFRTDIRPYLTKARVEEITSSVVRKDLTFACHKTTQLRKKNWSACAGSLILVNKSGWRNALYQIAERFGFFKRDDLNMQAPVFETAQEMIDAQD